jgi:hypothetical protein
MTRAARVVLDDCRGALAELTDRAQGATWRRRWVTVIALLRIVGHVLKRVDAPTNPALRAAVDQAWRELNRSKPVPQILWGFIEEERNNILKEYRIGAGHDVTVYVGADRPADYRYVVNAGPYQGRLQTEVVSEAIAWWEGYLDAVDQSAKRAP